MKIEIDTKFDIGDEVWFMENNMPHKGEIVSIMVHDYKYLSLSDYSTPLCFSFSIKCKDKCISRYVEYIFATKRELIESLMNEGDKEE